MREIQKQKHHENIFQLGNFGTKTRKIYLGIEKYLN